MMRFIRMTSGFAIIFKVFRERQNLRIEDTDQEESYQ